MFYPLSAIFASIQSFAIYADKIPATCTILPSLQILDIVRSPWQVRVYPCTTLKPPLLDPCNF